MMHQKHFTLSNSLSQTEYKPVVTRPHDPGDHCYYCTAEIGGDVTEIQVAPDEIRFYCEFCVSDPDAPLAIALTGKNSEAI